MNHPTFILLLLLIPLLIANTQSKSKNVTSSGRLNKFSPLDVGNTRATMTQNSFEKGGDGGDPSECDGNWHSNNFLIVALSTRWYNKGQRCFDYINIYYKGNSVRAMVVDECDSNRGCRDDIVDASYAVWLALQVSQSDWGQTEITWSDA